MGSAEQDLSKLRQRYMEWLLTPKAERQPATKRGIAEELRRSEKTLRDWEALPDFRAEWESRARTAMGGPERLKEIADALFAQALDPDSRKQVAAAKLFAELVGAHTPSAPEVNVNLDISKISTEELERFVAQQAGSELERRLTAVDAA